ncbi:MAG TPA: CHASE3 domain-containing protein [Steroidobacteraceae bacterium]|nr:CHASE3 domain-containing protein [Steroidobacteraceae bacterium]
MVAAMETAGTANEDGRVPGLNAVQAGGKSDPASLERKLLVAFAGVLVAVIVLALAVFDTARRALDASHWVAHTHEVLEQLDGMPGALARVEAAVFGFTITADDAYLRLRDNALSSIETRNQRLQRLIADSPAQQRRWKIVRHLVDERLALLDRAVVIRQTEGVDAAGKFLEWAISRESGTRIHATLGEMQAEEQRLLRERESREEQRRTIAIAAGLLFAAVFVVLFTLGYFAIRRQLSERRMAEEKIAALNATLQTHAQQLEAANKELESFSYSVSHDLRSPLRAIDGFARILTEEHGSKLDDEGRRLLGVVRDNSQKMGRLIDDLLAFSRLGRKPLANTLINMKRLVEEVIEELQASDRKSPELVVGKLPPAQGDAVLVRQVWANLLANAMKFSGKREQPLIEVSGKENGAEIVYCVKDNGAGFDMQYYDKLFGVFQRLHGATEFAGTGVGLAIVQRVVARHGGRVWAEGKVNEGAAFYFSMPRGSQDGQV